MTPARIRIVLADNVTEKEWSVFVWEAGWYFNDVLPQQPGHPFEIIQYRTTGGKTTIEEITDFVIDQRYLLIHGVAPETEARKVRAGIATVDDNEIRRNMREAQTRDEKLAALYPLALVTPPRFNPEDNQLLEAALQDTDADIRRAAICAVGYVEWPELEAKVRQMETADPDSAVRETAGRLREAIEHRDAGRLA